MSAPPVLLSTPLLLAVNKPAGLPTQPDRTGDRSLLEEVEALERARDPHMSIGMPHRIDRPVSGLVLFTRTAEALQVMNELFRAQQVHKTYFAIVEGRTAPEGICEHMLEHDMAAHKARVRKDGKGELARLRYRTLVNGDRFSLLEVVPEGGAFHQIRAQLSASGHPIKGDVKYGARRGERDRSIGLHARSLSFEHPLFNGRVALEASVPATGVWPSFMHLAEGPPAQ